MRIGKLHKNLKLIQKVFSLKNGGVKEKGHKDPPNQMNFTCYRGIWIAFLPF